MLMKNILAPSLRDYAYDGFFLEFLIYVKLGWDSEETNGFGFLYFMQRNTLKLNSYEILFNTIGKRIWKHWMSAVLGESKITLSIICINIRKSSLAVDDMLLKRWKTAEHIFSKNTLPFSMIFSITLYFCHFIFLFAVLFLIMMQ